MKIKRLLKMSGGPALPIFESSCSLVVFGMNADSQLSHGIVWGREVNQGGCQPKDGSVNRNRLGFEYRKMVRYAKGRD